MALAVVHERCGGLDVHKKTVVAAIDVPGHREVRTFATHTEALRELVTWLQAWDVWDVAMEATGSYWKPVYNLLDAAAIRVVLANPQHIKTVPGRKTDVGDAEWICDLHRHGLIRPSLVPDRWQRELRELLVYRDSLIAERAAEANRIQKVLEGANIKLGAVVSDILGQTGRAILEALANGQGDLDQLAALAVGSLKKKRDELKAALRGQMGPHQRLMLRTLLDHVAFLDQRIAALDQEVNQRLQPWEDKIDRMDQLPGVAVHTAQVVLGVCGVDMQAFPDTDHIASWIGLIPGNNQSGGKRRRAFLRKGHKLLRKNLIQAAHAAGRTNTYLGALYRRIARKKGSKIAAVVVARHIIQACFRIVRYGESYRELGPNYYDERKREQIKRAAVRRLERLGYRVTLTETNDAA